MKKRTKLLLSAGLMAPLFVFAGVSAIETQTYPNNPEMNTTVKPLAQTEYGTHQTTMTPEQKAELNKRLEDRKANLKSKVNATDHARLKTRCKGSQGSLGSLSGRIKGIETSRTEKYGALVARLSTLQTRLQGQNIDTTKLQAEIDVLEVKIATFKTDLAAYRDSVADLSSMDCQADPVAFKASLETARTALGKLKQDGADIKSYVNDTIKPTLKEIRSQVEATKTNDSSTGGATRETN